MIDPKLLVKMAELETKVLENISSDQLMEIYIGVLERTISEDNAAARQKNGIGL